MANLDQIADFVADKTVMPFSFVDTIVYSSFSTGWTAPYSGFLVFTIEPSNTSDAHAYIRDNTDDITDVCKLVSVNSGKASCSMPVLKGHQYILRSSSANVQYDNRFYGRYYKLF